MKPVKLIEDQEIELLSVLDSVVKTPTEEHIENYLSKLNILEYSILIEAEKYRPKTPEYISIRKEAFATRAKYAKIMLTQWVSKYSTTSGCPHSYQDTLNIPFKQIKSPKF
jgi:hypothetical protein